MPSADSSALDELLGALVDVAEMTDAALAPAGRAALDRLAATAVIAFEARAASIAMVDEPAGELLWLAAAGAGGAAMIDVRLPIARGIAGYVAATGQSLSIGDVRGDPRFAAADVADRTGFVPTTMDCLPIETSAGATVGVLSLLDCGPTAHDADLAPAFAEMAAALIESLGATRSLARVLLDALRVAAGQRATLSVALRRVDARATDPVLVELAVTLADARELGPRIADAARRVLDDVVDLARLGRRR